MKGLVIKFTNTKKQRKTATKPSLKRQHKVRVDRLPTAGIYGAAA